MARRSNNYRKITSPQSLNAYIKGICDIMRRSGRAGALQYVPEITRMLFLRILDETEERGRASQSVRGRVYSFVRISLSVAGLGSAGREEAPGTSDGNLWRVHEFCGRRPFTHPQRIEG